jgi:hypothetical protein
MKIDNEFLNSIGIIGINEEEGDSILAQIVDIFNYRLGNKITETLTDTQIDEFEEINVLGDQAKTSAWLEKNVTQYKQIGDDLLLSLRTELESTHKEVLGY